MIKRRGEGFTPYENALLDEFLEDEIAIQGLYMLVAPKASIERRSDVYTRVGDGSVRTIIRVFDPITSAGKKPRSKRHVILSDTLTVSEQAVAEDNALGSISTEWYATIKIKEGRKTTNIIRPSLVSWQYVGAPALDSIPQIGGDWQFAYPGEVWNLVSDDIQHRQQLDVQGVAIGELQKVYSLLTNARA